MSEWMQQVIQQRLWKWKRETQTAHASQGLPTTKKDRPKIWKTVRGWMDVASQPASEGT
ncbi:hypothetical protein M419DRAFT_119738 [Trichoderma reesei RUT C-30]|jgi:hypothetical protein|uniref:Uncharacterized protein n=1 Tax=Hypocrea jecorina (strain ATCC 56765 / BCRC 32924 / NRRL 11460 / Rut C-30) TaxID=1344414 RepID=A0A024S8I8_HYPJR|nr:hypothetical protein M419DRAFT_119738 [Trichoderma reesei RUT C-30]